MLHRGHEPFFTGYQIKRNMESHVVPAHSHVNEVEQPWIDFFAANKLNSPRNYACLPLTSHRRILPTVSQAMLHHEAHWVEKCMRCRRSHTASAEICPVNTVGGPWCEERYSAYGHIRQRDTNRQLGRVMQTVARDGMEFISPLDPNPPTCPVVAQECRADKSFKIPPGFSRVLLRASDGYSADCRPCKVIDLPRPEEYSGRLLY
ncbi:hypothetical protein TSMEX_001368 [Taenia solium]|eukprot:TsM_000079300 transcript=TsM_000079300 gene=TsM_000079300